ncbi:MAG: dipeptidase [Thermoanaerobaculia bacterium]
MRTRTSWMAAVLLLAACGPREAAPRAVAEHPAEEEATMERAERLAHEAILVDTHIDVPFRLDTGGDEDLSRRTAKGDFDHPRAVAGGLDAAFMSIYVPAELQDDAAAAQAKADHLIDLVEGFTERWPERFALATSPADVRRLAAIDGMVALPLGMENGAPMRTLEDARRYAARGIRYVTLTHGEDNLISDSSYAETATWGGLSPYGRELVGELNRLGVMIDVSHVSDDAFRQAVELSKAPVIASHSSCRHFTPGFERNASDELIRLLADAGGVVQINFGSAFLRQDANVQGKGFYDERTAAFEEQGIEEGSPAADAWDAAWWEGKERIYADVTDVADHIEHVIDLVGVEHVGIGSDFDGVGDSLPTGLKDVSQYPNLIAELLRRGHSEDDLRLILGENLLRVWERVDQVAAELASGESPVS